MKGCIKTVFIGLAVLVAITVVGIIIFEDDIDQELLDSTEWPADQTFETREDSLRYAWAQQGQAIREEEEARKRERSRNKLCTPALVEDVSSRVEPIVEASTIRFFAPQSGYQSSPKDRIPVLVARDVNWYAAWSSLTFAEKERFTKLLVLYRNCVLLDAQSDWEYIELRDLHTNKKFASITVWGGFKIHE